jgi:hypothetical protein
MKNAHAIAAAAAAFLASAQSAFAQPDYVDDRSSAEAVVRSLYNAISRKEYSRAWSYFGETKPAKNFDAFVNGYSSTDSVDVKTGGVSEEGAAGSIFFTVPVAIAAVDKNGDQKIFAGCYTLRQVNAQIQEPPFDPIHIEKGTLKPSSESLEDAVPEKCGDGPAPPKKDAMLEQAQKAFIAAYGDQCDQETPDGEPINHPQSYSIHYKDKDAGADEPEREVRLFRFYCHMAAYNESALYYVADDVNGVRQLQFAVPELDIRYADKDSDEKVDSVNVTGFQTEDFAVNSDYDEASFTITTADKWRGVGDASSTGTYLFRNGNFSLVKYDVDASYDGEINPQTVVDYYTAP